MNIEELKKKIEEAKDMEELRNLKAKLEKLQNEQKELEEERKLLRDASATLTVDETELREIKTPEKLNAEVSKAEERGQALKDGKAISVTYEDRSTTVSSGSLLVEKKYKRTIDESFEGVSGLIDEVNSIQLDGGDSYSVAFEKGYGEGDYTEEGADYADSDPAVDYVETGRAKITAYSEITKEAIKLPNINYEALVVKRVRDAIRKKISRQLVAGSGATNTIKGIYNADIKVLSGDSDVEIAEIDADTLNTLVFAYGGDEALENEEKLILSKADLQAFSKVKDAQDRFVYKITKNGRTGRIAYAQGGLDVAYAINSACNSLSDSDTTEGDFTMVYGSMSSFEMPVFSSLAIEESKDYKFKQGIIAYRGDVIIGGTVSKYNGFVRVKKAASETV